MKLLRCLEFDMNILIDTHIALWAIADKNKLLKETLDELEKLDNNIYVSIASIWEVAIKNTKHSDIMPMNENAFVKNCKKMEFEFLPIKISHIINLRNLKEKNENILHKDPFDRMILSQCLTENMTLYTHDKVFENYDVQNVNII